jgi:outer membrane biosynthesis protein TonB
MAVTKERAEEYRRLAADCVVMARLALTEEARTALIDQAQTWLRLAEKQEQQEAPDDPSQPSVPEQPTVQQQQQTQPKKKKKKDKD